MAEYVNWRDVKARARELDPRSEVEREESKKAARVRHEAYLRGHQLAEMRRTAQLTQSEVAVRMGISQSRVSQIEAGEISGIDIVRAYVTAVGGHVDVTATLGDRSWKVA